LHGLLRQFANQGRAVIVSASEREELAAIADRVIVLRRGQITSELKGMDLRPDSVVEAATHGAAAVA
jgi:ribose transport system ATP-binding protein